MSARRGVALLAALWLVVGIAAVALQFSIEAHERRTMGLLASERGIQRATASGALALVQARMEQALRVAPTGTNVDRLRSSDPWLDVDSLYSGPVYVDSIEVDVQALDLGSRLNINSASETELQTFFSFVLKDYEKSTELAQSIMDWRDPDSIPRPNGAERDQYLKAERLALPTNSPFREIGELQNVMGMTPEIYAAVSPYLSVRSTGINVNTAPAPVLRTLPNMTDAILNMILQMRSQGRRINSMSDIFGSTSTGTSAQQIARARAQAALTGRVSFQTNVVELTITARAGPQAAPTKLTALVSRAGGGVSVGYKEW
jgi:general secretion pathway protein K